MRNSNFLWLDYVAIAIFVITFFVISYCGFFFSDDLSMAYGGTPIGFAYGGTPMGFGERVGKISSIIDVFKLTRWWYFHLGGRFFSVAAQYLFCGLIGNKLWFDIVNTLFFLLLMIVCGKLVGSGKKESVHYVLLFALLFWFFCPVPGQTLFWVAGSTTYLWANTFVFVFLLFFLMYKDKDFSFAGKVGLFIFSFIAATEFISCVSICGAFVVYYVFHIKKIKGNVVPLVVGFVIGSVLVLFAPGNFLRASMYYKESSFFDRIRELVFNPIQEIIKYKALWMFLIVLVWGWINNKIVIKTWMKHNAILLLSLGWSVVAFSVIFRPADRAVFYTETLSLILFLRLIFENYYVFGIRLFDQLMSNINPFFGRTIIVVIFIVFLFDSSFAISETKEQSKNNDFLLKEIVGSGGIVALDEVVSSHRMANIPIFPEWTWKPLADKFGLDSVHVYPYYCREKFYTQLPPLESIYIDETNYKNDNDIFGKYVRLIVRIKIEELQASDKHVTFTIDYSRPRKWYKSWMDKWRNYQYDRTIVVERDKPDVCFDGYCYYLIWFGRENVSGLKSVKYEIE